MEHNAHEYTECPKCEDTVLDLNMLYDEDGKAPLHCTNCDYDEQYSDPGTIHEYDLGCGDYDIEPDFYEPNPYDGTYSEM